MTKNIPNTTFNENRNVIGSIIYEDAKQGVVHTLRIINSFNNFMITLRLL